MSPGNDSLVLQVISDNQQISSRIETELHNATHEILVAAAWFTDPAFFDILLLKLDQGVRIELILADNAENEKLDFEQLEDKGADILKVKNVGYGMMHQKFAIFDRRLAIHGSYNWSINARNNNHESVIITNDRATIESLYETFHTIKNKAKMIKLNMKDNYNIETVPDGISSKSEIYNTSEPYELNRRNTELEKDQEFNESYHKVLQSLIVSEFGDFDRSELRQQGYDRAKICHGEVNSLKRTFDSLYSVFINSINISDGRKQVLLTKIEEERVKARSRIEEIHALKSNTIEQAYQNKRRELENQIVSIKSQIDIQNNRLSFLKEEKIPEIHKKIESIREKINNIELEFLKPVIKRFEMIPVAVLNIGLLLYLLLFYSSAAYIFLFSEQNAIEAKLKGVIINSPEVFNPFAISEAIEKGFFSVAFILLFVFIPISLSLLGTFLKQSPKDIVITYIAIIVVDFALAYKVTESLHRVRYLAGNITENWEFLNFMTDFNFYLVFILGALGLFLFKFAFQRLINIYQDTDQQNIDNRNKILTSQCLNEIERFQEEISAYNAEINELRDKIIECDAEKVIKEAEIVRIDTDKVQNIEVQVRDKTLKLQHIEDITTLYRSHIENNSLIFSVHSMKDRINVFMEGWNKFLFEEFSVARASEKSTAALEVSLQWEIDKLPLNAINGLVYNNN